jgi:alkylation response protein AidB-like acyl-CoA dehydrogenase
MFNDVKVPKSNLLGDVGMGFKIAMNILNGGRIGIAAQALGIASGAYELSLRYARERKSFGKLISEHQAIQFKLADMHAAIEGSRLLCYKAAYLKDKNIPFSKDSAVAKLVASQTAMDVADEAIQIHGGYGYVKEYHVERMLRDAKITQIYEGTSEIQRLVIAREILKSI